MPTRKLFQPASLNDLRLSKDEHEAAHSYQPLYTIRTNINVLDISDPSAPRTLILQRADSNCLAGEWECPNGAIQPFDFCILAAVARHLQYQTGLREVTKHLQIERSFAFLLDGERPICQLNIILPLTKKQTVKIDTGMHKRFEWATADRMSAMNDDNKLIRKEIYVAALLAFQKHTPPKHDVDERGRN